MRGKLIAGAAVAGMLGSGLILVPTASADSGDGYEACNKGEICFVRSESNRRYRKHFWYSASHSGYEWWDASENHGTGIGVRNDAQRIANRDTVCDVTVVDDRGVVPDDTHRVPNLPDERNFIYLRGPVDNENDRHERC